MNKVGNVYRLSTSYRLSFIFIGGQNKTMPTFASCVSCLPLVVKSINQLLPFVMFDRSCEHPSQEKSHLGFTSKYRLNINFYVSYSDE